MNTREQSNAIKKTVAENAAGELVLEHACKLVETFPISKEKALILSVIRSWDSLDSITKKKVNDRIKAIAEVDLDLIGEASEIDEVFSLIFQSGEKKIPDWFHLLWSGSSVRKPSGDGTQQGGKTMQEKETKSKYSHMTSDSRAKIESGPDGELYTEVYYCDPMNSNQKASCERNHSEIRRVIPKSTDIVCGQDKISFMMDNINSMPRFMYANKSAYEMFCFLHGQDAADASGLVRIPAEDVTLKPYILL